MRKKIIVLLSTVLFLCSLSGLTKEEESTGSRFEELEVFNKVLFLIESQYYRQVSTKKLVEGALKGMMDTLDPHSAYLNEEVFHKIQEDTRGEFGGLGVEVTQKDGVIVVVTPIEDSPAFKAGIKPGDKIVEINYESTLGLTLDQAIDRMKGEIGDKVNIGVSRVGKPGITRFELVREKIKVSAVKSKVLEDHYAYIRLIQFQQDSGEQVSEAIKKAKKKTKGKLKGIVLDLRSNPGGLLDEAVNISSLFLKSGVIVSTQGRDQEEKDIRYVKKGGYKELELPIVVLINSSSASASEIVAGALQDQKRAIIMGTPSFGKGTVQSVAKIDDKRGVKLTIAQYMTPSGRRIQALGIEPDVVVENIDMDEFEKTKLKRKSIREKDLRNHLTATIETQEEKEQRIAQEKEERRQRILELEQKKKKGKKKQSDDDFNPSRDYQVIQAIKYLKSMPVLKKVI